MEYKEGQFKMNGACRKEKGAGGTPTPFFASKKEGIPLLKARQGSWAIQRTKKLFQKVNRAEVR